MNAKYTELTQALYKYFDSIFVHILVSHRTAIYDKQTQS